MSSEEVIEVLKKIEKELNTNRKLNEDILTTLLTILAVLFISVFFILTSFPEPIIAVIILVIPILIGIYKIISRNQKLH